MAYMMLSKQARLLCYRSRNMKILLIISVITTMLAVLDHDLIRAACVLSLALVVVRLMRT